MSVVNNDSWREFFEEFRDCPELWQIKSKRYRNKDLKNKAWARLQQTYLKIDSGATISSLKNKITNIRLCYRRELKKKEQSKKSGAGADDIYLPSLWYFDTLFFLKDNEISIFGTSTMDSDDNIEEIEFHDLTAKKKCSNRKMSGSIKEEFLETAVEHLKVINKTKDEAEIFAESWVLSYRKLSESQKIFAKKAIEEIFILGQFNQLSLNVVSTSPSVCNFSNSPFMSSRSSTPLTPSPTPYTRSKDVILDLTKNKDNHSTIVYNSLQDLLDDTQYS